MKKTIKTKISFSLREVVNDSEIYVKAKNNEDQTDVREVIASGFGTYTATVDLSVSGNYNFMVIEKGNLSTKTYELGSINLKTDLSQKYKYDLRETDNNEQYYLYIYHDSSSIIDPAFKMKDVIIKIEDYTNNNELFNKSIFNELVNEDGVFKYKITFPLGKKLRIILEIYNEFGIAYQDIVYFETRDKK